MSASSLADFFLYVCGNKIGPLKQILALQIFILAVSLGIYARDGHCARFHESIVVLALTYATWVASS